jgi:putative membrane protein
MSTDTLPLINACLNGVSTVLLTVGILQIKAGNRVMHQRCMTAAFVTSCVFLVLYLVHKYVLKSVHTPFRGPDSLKVPYYLMLISHVTLAAAVPPLALITIRRGLVGNFELHKKIARWTFPIWMYVSVTGVLVYLVLYQIWPAR